VAPAADRSRLIAQAARPIAPNATLCRPLRNFFLTSRHPVTFVEKSTGTVRACGLIVAFSFVRGLFGPERRIRMLSHIDETVLRWEEAGQAENVYRRWTAYFYPMLGDTVMAEALCELGMRVVRREVPPGPKVRSEFDRIFKRRSQTSPSESSTSPTDC
jgi:hypothetical protein